MVLGIRRDGQKVLLSVRNMGGESEAAWRGVLDDLVARGLKTPQFLIIDGGAGLERALAALWPEVPTQRCTVHKHRNLLAHAPEKLHEEITADYNDMIYAKTTREIGATAGLPAQMAAEVPRRRRQPGRSRRPLFTFTRLPPSQWKSAGPPTPSSGCTRSSSGASRRRRAALCRDRRHVVLGLAGLGADRHAQGRRLAEPRHPSRATSAPVDLAA